MEVSIDIARTFSKEEEKITLQDTSELKNVLLMHHKDGVNSYYEEDKQKEIVVAKESEHFKGKELFGSYALTTNRSSKSTKKADDKVIHVDFNQVIMPKVDFKRKFYSFSNVVPVHLLRSVFLLESDRINVKNKLKSRKTAEIITNSLQKLDVSRNIAHLFVRDLSNSLANKAGFDEVEAIWLAGIIHDVFPSLHLPDHEYGYLRTVTYEDITTPEDILAVFIKEKLTEFIKFVESEKGQYKEDYGIKDAYWIRKDAIFIAVCDLLNYLSKLISQYDVLSNYKKAIYAIISGVSFIKNYDVIALGDVYPDALVESSLKEDINIRSLADVLEFNLWSLSKKIKDEIAATDMPSYNDLKIYISNVRNVLDNNERYKIISSKDIHQYYSVTKTLPYFQITENRSVNLDVLAGTVDVLYEDSSSSPTGSALGLLTVFNPAASMTNFMKDHLADGLKILNVLTNFNNQIVGSSSGKLNDQILMNFSAVRYDKLQKLAYCVADRVYWNGLPIEGDDITTILNSLSMEKVLDPASNIIDYGTDFTGMSRERLHTTDIFKIIITMNTHAGSNNFIFTEEVDVNALCEPFYDTKGIAKAFMNRKFPSYSVSINDFFNKAVTYTANYDSKQHYSSLELSSDLNRNFKMLKTYARELFKNNFLGAMLIRNSLYAFASSNSKKNILTNRLISNDQFKTFKAEMESLHSLQSFDDLSLAKDLLTVKSTHITSLDSSIYSSFITKNSFSEGYNAKIAKYAFDLSTSFIRNYIILDQIGCSSSIKELDISEFLTTVIGDNVKVLRLLKEMYSSITI
jgi:hypothetical protein